MKGYTLVEMLVAMVVVAICASLLLPGVEKVKAAAQRSACVSNMRQIGQASLLYHADRQTILPWYTYADGYWWQALAPYTGTDTRIFHCPRDKSFLSEAVDRTISYGWNYKLTGHGDSGADSDDFLRLQTYAKPAGILVATDGPGGTASGQEDSWGYIDERTVHTADPKRHAGQGSALFLDGHVETIFATNFPNNALYQDRTQHLQ